jgi:hypothetical protein
MTQSLSRAEKARQRAQEEQQRLDQLARKTDGQSADLLDLTVGAQVAAATTATVNHGAAVRQAAETPPAPVPASTTAIGPSADRPIEKVKPDRQGIDLRPVDRERIYNFDLLCIRIKTGKKKGLSLYARAGFVLLEQLIDRDRESAIELLKSVV